MKKIVNGEVVSIDNIKLFELAYEGMIKQRKASSLVKEALDKQTDRYGIRNIIGYYSVYMSSIPFPLYYIEEDVKYASIAEFIRWYIDYIDNEDELPNLRFWIDDGLIVNLSEDTKMSIKFINDTWSICYPNEIGKDNAKLDMYKNEVGYTEFKIANDMICDNGTIDVIEFYTKIMPKFVKACNNDINVISWEIQHMLEFAYIPKQINFKEGKLIDLDNDREIIMDIYESGERSTGEKVRTVDKNDKLSSRDKKMKVYLYTAYEKALHKVNNTLIKCDYKGLQDVFFQMCKWRNIDNRSDWSIKGMIVSGDIYFEVQKRIFICKLNKVDHTEMIVDDAELINVENGLLYFKKKQRISMKVTRESIFAYNMLHKTYSLCAERYL